MGKYTFSLFARPTFFEGMGRILDFGNTLTQYNVSPTPEEADANALYSDWCAIGDDLHDVMSRYGVTEKQPGDSSPGTREVAR